jgi:hypothetical protein
MNRFVVLFSVVSALFFTSCGESSESAQSGTSGPSQVQENMAGNYEGNLGCPDCVGIKTILEIKADSTFIIRESKMNPGQMSEQLSFTGKVNFMNDLKMIELAGRQEASARWFKTDATGNLQVVTQDGTAVVDSLGGGNLSRLTKWTQAMGDVNIYEYVQPFSKYPAKVFHRIQNGDITLDRTYIANAPEHEKALIAYYATVYNAACEGEVCLLKNELKGEAEKLTAKYFQNDPILRPMLDVSATSTKTDLELLMIFSNQGKIRVQSAAYSADGKLVNTVDEFSLSGDNLIRINTQQSDNTRKRGVSNIKARETGPSSQAERDKIIDSKKK